MWTVVPLPTPGVLDKPASSDLCQPPTSNSQIPNHFKTYLLHRPPLPYLGCADQTKKKKLGSIKGERKQGKESERKKMAEVLGSNFCVPCATLSVSTSLSKQSSGLGFSPSPSSLRFHHSMASSSTSLRTDFYDKPGGISEIQSTSRAIDNPQAFPVQAQSRPWLAKALKWWEKGLQPNMREIDSAEDLVNSLRDAGNQLVIVDFFSPGCGGCRSLHPKICQLAEMNSDVLFLQINYEKHKSMCYSLNVHVLPFFRFYRGAQGRLCSFSCTNATIKKFKDALAKHTTDRCSLGPAKGLEESEILALAANKELSFSYPTGPKTSSPVPPARPEETHHRAPSVKPSQEADGRELVTAIRR